MSRQQFINYNCMSYFTEGVDIEHNPEISLMTAEGDMPECDIEESFWLSGKAITRTTHAE